MFVFRSLPLNRVLYAQADLYNEDKSRKVGVQIADVQSTIFWDNTVVPWPIVEGAGIQPPFISSGRLYWHEISSGFYSVRFRPNAVGYWRLVVVHGVQDNVFDFDVTPPPGAAPPDLRARFSRT